MIIEGQVRHQNLITAWAYEDKEENKAWSVTILIKKSSPQVALIQKAIDEAILIEHPKGKPVMKPDDPWKTCFKDLAVYEPENEVLKDYMQLKCSTKTIINGEPRKRPPILNTKSEVMILDPQSFVEIQGKMVLVQIVIKAYKKNDSSHLNGTQVSDHNGPIAIEFLSSKPRDEDMFKGASFSEQEPVAPPEVEAPPAPPVARVMTDKAQESYETYQKAGWSDAQLIEAGYLEAPGGVAPSFAG